MIKKTILMITLALFTALFFTDFVKADESKKLFDEGNDMFFMKQYEDAREAYELLINTGHEDPSVYYNLASVYMYLNMPGKAALNLHRARKLEPRSEDIQRNLRVIDKLNRYERNESGGFSVKSFVRAFSVMSKNEIAALIVIFYSLFFAWSLLRKFLRKARFKKAIGILAVASYIWSIIFIFIFVATFYYDAYYPETVVMETVELKTSPADDENYLAGISLRAGTMVELENTYKEWGEVILADGKTTGWIRLETLEKI